MDYNRIKKQKVVAAEADRNGKLLDFILGLGKFPFAFKLDYDLEYNKRPRGTFIFSAPAYSTKEMSRDIREALNERYERVNAVEEYLIDSYSEGDSRYSKKNRAIILALHKENTQLAWDIMQHMNHSRSGSKIVSDKEFLGLALVENSLSDYLLSRNKFTNYGEWGGPYDPNRIVEFGDYYKSLPMNSSNRMKLRAFLLESIHKKGDEKDIAMHIVATLLEDDPKLKEAVDKLLDKVAIKWIYNRKDEYAQILASLNTDQKKV